MSVTSVFVVTGIAISAIAIMLKYSKRAHMFSIGLGSNEIERIEKAEREGYVKEAVKQAEMRGMKRAREDFK